MLRQLLNITKGNVIHFGEHLYDYDICNFMEFPANNLSIDMLYG